MTVYHHRLEILASTWLCSSGPNEWGLSLKGYRGWPYFFSHHFDQRCYSAALQKPKEVRASPTQTSATYLTQVSCVVYTHIHVYSTRYSWLTPLHSASEAPGESRGLQSLRCDQIVPRKDSSSAKCCREAEELWKTQVWLTARCWNLKKEKEKKTWLKAAAYEGNEHLIYWPIRLSVYLFSSAGWMQFSDGAKWQSWPGGKTRTTRCCQSLKNDLFSERLYTDSKRKTTMALAPADR